MDENESSDSINETGDDSNECNESDNKLTQYMLINKVIYIVNINDQLRLFDSQAYTLYHSHLGRLFQVPSDGWI